MTPPLRARCAAELIGSAFLVMAVVGSGIAASRLYPGQIGAQLLANSLATGAVLAALILALQQVSASFNPVVTLVERVQGLLGARETGLLVASQLTGAIAGAMLANVMFGLDPIQLATTVRTGTGVQLAEVVATFGLVLLIGAAVRAGGGARVALTVAGYITAAYWFTSSTSFANPAVTVARTLSDTFTGIAPGSAAVFVALQLLGGALALAALRILNPSPTAVREPAAS